MDGSSLEVDLLEGLVCPTPVGIPAEFDTKTGNFHFPEDVSVIEMLMYHSNQLLTLISHDRKRKWIGKFVFEPGWLHPRLVNAVETQIKQIDGVFMNCALLHKDIGPEMLGLAFFDRDKKLIVFEQRSTKKTGPVGFEYCPERFFTPSCRVELSSITRHPKVRVIAKVESFCMDDFGWPVHAAYKLHHVMDVEDHQN